MKFTKVQFQIAIVFLYFPGLLYARPDIDIQITNFLQKYTTQNGVKYYQLKNNLEWKTLIEDFQKIPLPKSRDARFAYWLNAYNLMTIKLISDNYPVKSITNLHLFGSIYIGYIFNQTIWQSWNFQLHNKNYTLDQIEHEIIRTQFKDFRAHAAMVCAARSCPPLGKEAYHADKLDSQLNEQMVRWLANPEKNYYQTTNNTLYISSIFKWFEDDFYSTNKDLKSVINPYLSKVIQKKINNKTNIRFLEYNWDLNEVK